MHAKQKYEIPILSNVVEGRVRFVLSEINEDEIRHDGAYDVFEPIVSLKIDGRNVFEKFGSSGPWVVIMDSLEGALVAARQMTILYPHGLSVPPKQEYSFWLTSTGITVKLERDGDELDVFLEMDPDFRPVGSLESGSHLVGHVTVREWVEGVVALAKDLHDIFQRLNPETYAGLGDQKRQISELESWLEGNAEG